MRPGNFWMLKFGKVPGSIRRVEKEFKLDTRKYAEYKGVRFGNGDYTLVVDVWFHRVHEDTSGLTFEEWDPSADTDVSEAPVTMIVNSSELCTAGFDLRVLKYTGLREALILCVIYNVSPLRRKKEIVEKEAIISCCQRGKRKERREERKKKKRRKGGKEERKGGERKEEREENERERRKGRI